VFDRPVVRWSAVAGLVLIVAVSGWLYARRGDLPSTPPEQTAVAEVRLELSLRPYAASRGETNLPEQPPLALSSRRVTMSLLLPAGSEQGPMSFDCSAAIRK
jgi:hypothetical protein